MFQHVTYYLSQPRLEYGTLLPTYEQWNPADNKSTIFFASALFLWHVCVCHVLAIKAYNSRSVKLACHIGCCGGSLIKSHRYQTCLGSGSDSKIIAMAPHKDFSSCRWKSGPKSCLKSVASHSPKHINEYVHLHSLRSNYIQFMYTNMLAGFSLS